MSEASRLHGGSGMRRLLDTLGQSGSLPGESSRFDQTTPDGLVRLILEADGTCIVDIDHFGSETDNGTARVEAAITDLYNRASANARTAGGQTGIG